MWDTLRRWLGGWQSVPGPSPGPPLNMRNQIPVMYTAPPPSMDVLTLIMALLNGRSVPLVSTNLHLSGLKITSLPDQLQVAGTLDLRGCPSLRSLGKGTTVWSDLNLGGWTWNTPDWKAILHKTSFVSWAIAGKSNTCPIESLPTGMVVRGHLDIRSCPQLKTLPEDLQAEGDITLHGCSKLESLPLTKCNGNLTITGAPALRALRPGLAVLGNLTLNGVGLTELPAGLFVKKNLAIGHLSRLQRWPDTLEVGGNLSIVRTSMPAMPKLHVGRSIKLVKVDKLQTLPAITCSRSIRVEECNDLERIEDGLSVEDSLSLLRCPKLVSLPSRLNVPGTLNLTGCSALEHLPAQLDLGSLYRRPLTEACLVLSGTRVQSWTGKGKLLGLIDVTNSALKKLPGSYAQRHVLFRRVRVPSDYFFHPERLSPEEILTEPNAELRRIALEVLGVDRVLEQAQVKVLHEDTDAGGPRRLVQLQVRSETLRFLQCRCPSTGRQYLLRVSPQVTTCQAAAAWMAGIDVKSYTPKRET